MAVPDDDRVNLFAGLLREVRIPGLPFEPPPTIEERKAALGIDDLIFHLAASSGREITKKKIESEIDKAITQLLEEFAND